MKKYILSFLAIILCISFTCGCSILKKKNPIIGTWTMKDVQGGPVTITFGDNNSLEYKSAYYQNKGTYKIKKNVVKFIGIWDNEVEYEYEIKDDILSLTAVDKMMLSYTSLKKVK